VELQSLERERDSLDVEWGKLQLEQSTWATHERIESLARKRLGLRLPPISETVLVTP
jgi:cell division protein FtsL